MALSYAVYPADGSTQQFDLTFGYLQKSHVFVFVDGELVGFKWVSPTRVELITVPDPEQFVRIQRLTDRSSRITDFTDGQTLLAGDLNAGDLQNFYILQELLDQIVDGVLTGAVPVLDNGQGYITEQWINEQLNGSLEQSAALASLSNRIVDEEIARATAIAEEAQQRLQGLVAEASARVTAVQGVADDIAAEAQARITAVQGVADDIAAEAQARVAALQTVTDNLATEVADRIASVQGVASDLVDEVSLRVLGDTNLNAAIVSESQARQDADVAFGTQLSGIVTRMGDAEAAILTEATARSTADDALSQLLTVLTTRVGDAEADIVSEQQARTTADAAIASDVTLLTTRVGAAEADIISEQTARTTADAAIVTDVNALTTRMGDAEADIVSEQTARTTADTAITTDLSALTTRMGDAEADIISEQTARTTADTAITTDLSALTTRVGDAEADIISEQTARTTADTAITTDLSALTTRVGDAEADILSEQTARTTADTAITTDLSALTTRVGDAEADIISEQTARTTADTAITTDLSALTTRVGTAEADITTVQQSVVDETSARTTAVNTLQAAVNATEDELFLASLNDVLVGGHLVAGDKTRDASVGYVRSVNVGASDEVIFDNVPSTDWGYVNILPDAPLDVSGYRYVVLTVTALSAASPWLPVVRWLSSSGGLSSNGVQVNPSGYLTVGQKTTVVYDMAGITAGNGDVWDTANAMTRLVVYGNQLSQAYSFQIHDIAIVRQSDNPSGLNTSASLVELKEAVATTTDALATDITALTTRVGNSEADIISEQTARTAADTALTTSLNALTTRVGNSEADIISEQTARTSADTAITTDLGALTTRVGTSEAGIITNSTAISNEATARAAETGALSVRVGTAEADIITVNQAIVDEASARVDDVEKLTARYDVAAQAAPNLVYDPRFRDTSAWGASWDGNHGLPTAWGFDHGWTETHPAYKVAWKTVGGIPANNTVAQVPAAIPEYRVPVKQGARYYCSIFAAAHRAKAVDMVISLWDTNMVLVGSYYADNENNPKNGAQSDLSNFTRVGMFWEPVSDGFAIITARMIHDGTSADPYLWAALPSIQPVPVGSTEIPPLDVVGAEAERGLMAAASAQADATSAISLIADEASARATAVSRLTAGLRSEGGLVTNSKFLDWPATMARPNSFYNWATEISPTRETSLQRYAGVEAPRFVVDATEPNGFRVDNYTSNATSPDYRGVTPLAEYPEFMVASCEVYLVSGSWSGAGLFLDFRTGSVTGVTAGTSAGTTVVPLKDYNLPVGKWVRVSKLVSPASTTDGIIFYVMNNFSNLGALSTKDIIWGSVDLRPATPEEVEAQKISSIEGSISTVQQAIADEAGARAADITTVEAEVDGVKATVTTNAQAIATETSARVTLGDTLTASIGSLSSTVSIQGTAIADLENGLSGRLAFAVTSGNNAALFDLETGQEFGSAITLTANEINLNGNVLVNGTVLTGAIADGAMSTVEYFTNDLGIAITAPTSGTATPWIGIASKVLQVDVGRSVMVQAAAAVQASVDYSAGGFDPQADIRIRRGSTVIREIQSIIQGYHIGNGFNVLSNYVSIPEIDSPPPGTYTYTVEVRIRTTAGNASTLTGAVSNRTLILTEFKR